MQNSIHDIPNDFVLTTYRAFPLSFWDDVLSWDNVLKKQIQGNIVLKGAGFLDNFTLTEEETTRGTIILQVLNHAFETGSGEKPYSLSPHYFPEDVMHPENAKKGFRFTFPAKCSTPLKELARKGRSISAVYEIQELLGSEAQQEILDLFRAACNDGKKVAELQTLLSDTAQMAADYIAGGEFMSDAVAADMFKKTLRGYGEKMGIRAHVIPLIKNGHEDGIVSPDFGPAFERLQALEKKLEIFMEQARRTDMAR